MCIMEFNNKLKRNIFYKNNIGVSNCPLGVAQLTMVVDMKSHQTGSLGFKSCAILPDRDEKLDMMKMNSYQAYKKKILEYLISILFNTKR